VLGPLHSEEARGSVGSNTYSSWRGISVVKTRAGCGVYYTQPQRDLRAITIAQVRRWKTLSEAARQAWNYYAGAHLEVDWTGNDKRLTGCNWFVRCNVQLDRMAASVIDDPPSDTIHLWLENLYTQLSGAYTLLYWTALGLPPPAGAQLELWITNPMSTGRHPTLHDAKFLLFNDYWDSPVPLGILSTARYGVFCRLVTYDTGVKTPWHLLVCDV